MSDDFTNGYGPEEFLIKRALPGKYTLKENYCGNHQQTLAGATTVQANVTTGFGGKGEKTQAMTLRLKDEKEVVEVGSVDVGAEA